MIESQDPLWAALGELRESRPVLEARDYLAAQESRQEPALAWRRFWADAWPRTALAGTLGTALAGALAAVTLLFVHMYPGSQTLETGVGEVRRATLADGSVVTLNTDSRLRINVGREAREITLVAGQARFDVAHDASRPFRVSAGDITVTALGTAFDVIALPRRTAVTLIEGKVVVEAEDEPGRRATVSSVLAPGQQVALYRGGLTRPRPARLEATLAWQNQLVDLSDMKLADALEEVNRYSDTKVVVADPSLANEQVSGVFKAGDVEAVSAALRAYFGLVILRRGHDEIVLGRSRLGAGDGWR